MFNGRLRASLPARLTAVGFIIFIIFGNLWLTLALVGRQAPVWIGAGFFLGIGLALVAGVALGVLAIKLFMQGDQGAAEGGAGGDDASGV